MPKLIGGNMLYEDVVNSINFKLENSNFEKFKIDHVVDELNTVIRDLANKTNAYETMDYMQLVAGRVTYTLPNRIYKPTRAVYRGKSVDFVSQEEMDMNVPFWETHTSGEEDSTISQSNTNNDMNRDLIYLVYNNMGKREYMPYPKLLNTTVYPDVSELLLLGQLSDVEDSVYTYLYVNKISGANYLAEAPYGTVSDFNIVEVIKIYGSYLPEKVLAVGVTGNKGLKEEVDLEEIYVNALIYGTAGNLLMTSGRTEDMEKGKNFLQIYGIDETEVGALNYKQFDNSTRNLKRGNQYYRTPFQQ